MAKNRHHFNCKDPGLNFSFEQCEEEEEDECSNRAAANLRLYLSATVEFEDQIMFNQFAAKKKEKHLMLTIAQFLYSIWKL